MSESLPGAGDNIGVPYAEGITERLELEFAELLEDASDALDDSADLPSTVEASLDVSAIASMVVKLRDLSARAESYRVAKKEPYLRAGEMVQAFFCKRMIEPLDKTRKELSRRIDVFKQRQLAEERQRREAEAAELRRQQQEALKLKLEAEAAERRARSEQSREQYRAAAEEARIEETLAAGAAEEATLATMASASALVGERFEGDRSGKVGMRKMPVVFIDDVTQLDLEVLRPYLKEDVLLTALRAWARATNYSQQMPGATVGMRDATVVR